MSVLTRQGHCSQCGKIWTLDTMQGVCQWCGKPSTIAHNAIARAVNTHYKPRPDNGEVIELSYDQLDGEWADWLDTAKHYDKSVPHADQLDLRHTIILELATARARDGEPIPKLRQYRIASLCRIDYWREQNKGMTRVCIRSGVARALHCRDCQHKPISGTCLDLAVRPLLSLDLEVEDADGNPTTLAETIEDDTALDLEAWGGESSLWLLGFPSRLVEIAHKMRLDKPLSGAERKYLWKWRKREGQKNLL